MPLLHTVTNREETVKRVIDDNVELLAAGVPRQSIEGWNSYLMALKPITKPLAYDDVVWKTGRS